VVQPVTSLVHKALLATASVLVVVALIVPASAFAVSGVSMSGNASAAQYPKVESLSQSPGQETLNESAGGGSPGQQPQTVGGGGGGAQRLPFTGFLAAGVLLAGVALLGGGYALRRPVSA
jgi:hypothetical protein